LCPVSEQPREVDRDLGDIAQVERAAHLLERGTGAVLNEAFQRDQGAALLKGRTET
jgi:hypothetical protein